MAVKTKARNSQRWLARVFFPEENFGVLLAKRVSKRWLQRKASLVLSSIRDEMHQLILIGTLQLLHEQG